MNGGSLSFLANQLVRNSMGNAINKSDPERPPWFDEGELEIGLLLLRQFSTLPNLDHSLIDTL
jgi:hypothetical protein